MNEPTKNAALDEYREAAAQLRHAMSAQAEAREAQILANLKAAETSRKLMAAQERLERAEQALANPDGLNATTRADKLARAMMTMDVDTANAIADEMREEQAGRLPPIEVGEAVTLHAPLRNGGAYSPAAE